MVTIAISCKYCQETQRVVRMGFSSTGAARCKCKACGRTFQVSYTHNACKPGAKAQIIDMAINGSGINDTARVLKVSKSTVISTLKKSKNQ